MALALSRSLRSKLPLTVVALILLVGLSISTTAYIVIRRTLHQSAGDRLKSLSSQFTESFKNSVAQIQARAAQISRRPELAAYLAHPEPSLAPAAIAELGPRGILNPELTIRAELRDASGRVLISTDTSRNDGGESGDGDSEVIPWPELSSVPPPLDPASPTSGVGQSKLHQHLDAMRYAIVARVPADPQAYYVIWRMVSRTSQARNQIAGMLGSEAVLYIVNSDGTGWSDLGRPVPAPTGEPLGVGLREYSRANTGPVLAAVAPVSGTPWLFTIEFPERAIQAPARAFLKTTLGIASVCIAVGMLVAWVMSRRFTEPLQTLTFAADAIAAGDTKHRVAIEREDELGHLARAFNAMADDVEQARQRLERLVETRTGELRSAQESLARREKLALVGHLAGSIGHEIRNPLGVMANAIYYLETIQPDASPEVREYLGILRQQVQLSAKIVNDLLDLSKTTPARREPIHLKDVIDERLQKMATRVASLEADVPSTLPRVHVDPVHAGQVLDNLLSNAVQALDGAPGTVRVRARADEGFVCLEVSDTGKGVHADHISKIFEPLFTTKARGIGLGLAVSKALAQANGGDLSLVSGPGESATFAFTLPIEGSAA